jgi:hypothetical protein
MSVRNSTVSPTVRRPAATPEVHTTRPLAMPANMMADCTTFSTFREICGEGRRDVRQCTVTW